MRWMRNINNGLNGFPAAENINTGLNGYYFQGRVCQNSLILKKSQSPDFHKPGLCYV